MFPISFFVLYIFDLFLISSDCIGSCYSPGLEDSGERRPLLEVTEEEPPGHMVIEKNKPCRRVVLRDKVTGMYL